MTRVPGDWRLPLPDIMLSNFQTRMATFAHYVNAPYVDFLKRLGLHFDVVSARGTLIVDENGNEYIDAIAGYGNLNIGHNHPKVIEAVVQQLQSPQPFNWPFISAAHAHLAEELAQITPGDLECSLVVNSGSEAVDSVLKLVRLATGKPHVIGMRGAWHGFTFGAMSASDTVMCKGFEPMLADVTHVDYGNASAVESAITDRTGAVLVEPIQAESGAIVPLPGYLSELADICKRKEIILIFDEVKSGMAKSGRMFACEYDNAVPDVILIGKSLGGGAMPIGVITARRKVWKRFGFSFPMSSSSGAGNRLACAAALATLGVIKDEGLCERAARQGQRILEAAAQLVREFPAIVTGVTGRGLLIALHTAGLGAATQILKECVHNRVLLMTAFGDRSRILIEPPLCISDSETERLLDALRAAIRVAAEKDPTKPLKTPPIPSSQRTWHH